MAANPNSTMLLGTFSLLNLETNVRKHRLSFILFSSFFLGGHQSIHCFDTLDTCLFFYSFFCIATCFFHTKYLRDNTKKLEHLF
jgi:NADH:ubiquinone oxidoreductase subunit H